MTERDQHSGILAGLAGPVQVGRHEQARQALEDDFLDHVPRPLDAPGDTRIQRTVVGGESSDRRENLRAHLRFAALGILHTAHGVDAFGAGIELLPGDAIHPAKETCFGVRFLAGQGRGEKDEDSQRDQHASHFYLTRSYVALFGRPEG